MKIGEIAFTVDLPEKDLGGVATVLEEAFRLLARRLAGGPYGRSVQPRRLVLEKLQTAPLSLEELLGARGAERLADELYGQIWGGQR
jgi:hypothetical protein